MITVTLVSKTYNQAVFGVSGFAGGFTAVDVQYSTRPDFRFVLAPLTIGVTPAGGQVILQGLNQRTSYFVRMRERSASAVGGWTEPLAVWTPSNIAQILTPPAALKDKALIAVPETIVRWQADQSVAGHVVANLASDSPVEQWWSDDLGGGFALEMQTGGAPVDCLALLETNANAGTTIAVKAGASFDQARNAPAFSVAAAPFHASANLGGKHGYHALVRLAAPQSFSHWRIEIGGTAPPLGRFVASYACLGRARLAKNEADDSAETGVDLGALERTRDGSPDRRPGFERGRKSDFDIAMMTEAQWESQFAELRWLLGANRPALVIPNTKAGAFLHDRILYGPVSVKMVNPHSPRFTASLSVDSLI